MNRRLGDISFLDLLPDSIRGDKTIAAAAEALQPLLQAVTHSFPNLLIWARLDPQNARIIAPLQRLVDASGGLKPLSTDLLELLAWQLHVDFREVATTDEQLASMVRGSIPWHRIKGTPAAVREALAMYGVQARPDESGTGRHWAVYELELAQVPRGGTLANIVRVAEEAAPKRCQLRRVYGLFDRRPIILDRGPAMDFGYLDDDSGVWDPETGIKQSFGEVTGILADPQPKARPWLGMLEVRPFRAFYIDRAILDQWRLDTPTLKSHGFVGSSLVSLQSPGIEETKWRWEGPWDHRLWSGSAPAPRRKISPHRSLSKAQLVLDFARLDSPLERPDRQLAVVVDKPQRLDFSRLDAGQDELGVRRLYIDERFLDVCGGASTAEIHAAGFGTRHVCGMAAGRVETFGSGIGDTTYNTVTLGIAAVRRQSLPDGTEWTGPWNHRSWRDTGATIGESHEPSNTD